MKLFSRWISKREPWLIQNSKIPVFLSYFAPIDIWAISFGPFVWCRGTLSSQTIRHETIHYHQQIELLFIFHWVLYSFFFIKGLIEERSGKLAYRQNPFELEAYDNDEDPDYLASRKIFSWTSYL